jgi:plasmid stabilization system protein ParE
MLLIEILGAAEDELREAARYYRQNQSPRLQLDFIEKFVKARGEILSFPHMWPLSLAGTRCKRMERFPYSIFYVIREDRIIIVAVAHQRREPGYWVRRPGVSGD